MQFLAGQSLHEVSSNAGTVKPEGMNADDQKRTIGSVTEKRRENKSSAMDLRRRMWRLAIGGGCAVLVLVLFGLFHSQPLRESNMVSQAERTTLQDVNPMAMKAAPAKRASTSAQGAVYDSAPRAEGMNNLLVATSNAAGASATAPGGPMIARTVSLTIQVKDIAGSRSALDALLAQYQGYAAELNINTPENAPRSFGASLRIPATALPAALADLRKLGRVQNESQSGEEVTQQHADLAARLKNAHETEQRLLAILEQRTGKVADVLAVEEQISNTRGEIERMEAELKTLEHRVDFATVQLQLTEEFKAQFTPPSASVGTRMHNSLVAGLASAGDTVIGILLFFEEYGPVLLVWLAILGTPAWLVWRRLRRAESHI